MADSSNEEYNRDAGDYNETGESSSNVEWRSCEQVENGTPSTSPFWDTDTDEEGQKPAELYGKHTWKIENFSKITKRELRSDPFDAGGYKWYILIYPQGCDVHNHISLFLCVANHDKLLPGWSHFAQFTIAVVNRDPKKSKYSDTLHRFWKKEHDWGWKKFMELSKVQDGFLADGVLVIKAQVQVIREKAERPFRCLDRLYRRELVRIYMTNIENVYRRFVEEKRNRLSKLIDDKSRWSSFHAFWRGTSASARNCMSRERTDSILKQVVKHFFIEKEVTSTLVMDSLYSGLRALELQSSKGKKWRGSRQLERMPAPMVRLEREMLVLADDVIALLERAVLERVPPVKDDKVSQNRTTKDGTTIEEMSRDTIERDESRLTEIGRRILEIFTLAHIYTTIEVAYQEAVALKRQEELIREEEAWMNEPSKRDNKDKKSKKKQGKQKKNNKKGKEKEKEEKPLDENENLTEDLNEDISENGEDSSNGEVVIEPESADSELQENNNPVTEVIIKDEWTGKKNYISSSSANDDWVPVGFTNKNSSSYKNQTSPNRGKNQRSKNEKPSPLPVVITNISEKVGPIHVTTGPSFVASSNATPGGSGDSVVSSASSSNGRAPTPQPKHKIEQQHITVHKKAELKSQPQYQQQINSPSKAATPKAATVSSTPNPPEKPAPTLIKPSSSAASPNSAAFGAVRPVVPSTPTNPTPSRPTVLPFIQAGPPPSPKPEPVKTVVPKPFIPMKTESASRIEPVNPLKNATSPRALSRPLSAPVLPAAAAAAPRPATPKATQVQASPYLARSVSSVSGRVGTDPIPSPSSPSFVPQSYRNAITGSNASNTKNPLTGLTGPNPHPNPIGFATQSALLTARLNADASESNLSFFSSSPGGWNSQNDNGSDIIKPDSRTIAEEFPHMDMINGLLEDADLYWPHNGTLGAPYRQFPHSGSGRVNPLRDMGLSNGSGRVDPLRDMGLSSGSSHIGTSRDLANGSGRHDPLRDMGLVSDPLREMGLTSGLGRVDPLRDMGLTSGLGRVDPLRDMGLSNGSGRVDPLHEMGVLNSRVYGSSSGSGLWDVGNNSVFNNVPSYHLNNGHYDYASDLGMNLNLNLNLGSDLNSGYGIGDYSNLQNRFRYPYDNGR